MGELPTEAKYKRVQNYNDQIMSRNTTRISPFNGAIFGPGNVDRLLFNVPSEVGCEIDMDTLMFHCDVTPSIGAGGAIDTADIYFCNSIESIIQNLRIRKGTSFLLEDIQRHNYLDSMFMNYVSADWNACVGKAQMGIGSTVDRIFNHRNASDAAGAIVGQFIGTIKTRNYCFPLRLSGISQYSGLISTSLIDSVTAFQIELELAPAAECMMCYRTDAVANVGLPVTTASYSLSNCYMTYDIVRMVPEYHQQLVSAISRGTPLQIPYKTFRTSLYSLPAATNSITYNINDTVKSLNAVFISFFKVDEQGKFNVAGRDRLHFPNLKTAQLQLGSFYYPLQPIDCTNGGTQAFLETQKALGLSYIRGEYNGPFSFDGQQFIGPAWGTVQNLVQNGAGGANTGGIYDVDLYSTYSYLTNSYTQFAEPVALSGSDTAGYARNYAGAGANLAAAATGVKFMREVCATSPSQFMLGFNLKKVLDISEGEVAGVDLQSSGSGLMTLRLEFQTGGAPATYNVIVASLYDAVLEIQSNQQTSLIR